jgi:hypothetical protein
MITDYIYEFKAPNGVPSKCRIRLYEAQATFNKGDTFVICSQLDSDDAGMSVTNAAETIATGVMFEHRLQPMRTIWIEHYARRETVDRVTFDIYCVHGSTLAVHHPKWNRAERSYVEAMIGEKF